MLTLRTGVAKRVEFVFQSPSQIAESGLRGAGLYPRTHLGFGFRYTMAEGDRFGVALEAESAPPMSRFSPNQTQPKYRLGVNAEYALNPKLALGFSANGTSSGTIGFTRVLPTMTAKVGYYVTPRTQVLADVGSLLVAARSRAQSFGDFSIEQSLSRNVVFNVGLGTTFDPVLNEKAHYLASGFTFKP